MCYVDDTPPTERHSCYCPQRSCGKVIFSQVCVKNSVHGGRGVCVKGVCMAGGHVWQGRVCVARGCVWKEGVCMAEGHAWRGCVWQGCVWWGACVAGGCVWQVGVCLAWGHAWQGGKHAWQEKRQLQRAVRILLECTLVSNVFALLNFSLACFICLYDPFLRPDHHCPVINCTLAVLNRRILNSVSHLSIFNIAETWNSTMYYWTKTDTSR